MLSPSPNAASSKNHRSEDDVPPRPPTWKVWILASRPHTLTASLAPCIVGYAIAATQQQQQHPSSSSSSPSHPSIYKTTIVWFLFCTSIQLATNLHNDYADFVLGADTKDRTGHARATQKGWLTPSQTAAGATACLGAALALGILLDATTTSSSSAGCDAVLWAIVLSSCFNAVAYTGGPYPLGYVGLGSVSIAYSGLGEVFCILYFGFVATLTIPYLTAVAVQQQQQQPSHWTVAVHDLLSLHSLEALPAALMSSAIIVVNNARDRHTDILVRKKTLAVRFGALFCKLEYTGLVLATHAVQVYKTVVATQHQQRRQASSDDSDSSSCYWHLLPLLTLPLSLQGIHAIWTLQGSALNPFVGKTALCELLVCILQSIALFFTHKQQ